MCNARGNERWGSAGARQLDGAQSLAHRQRRGQQRVAVCGGEAFARCVAWCCTPPCWINCLLIWLRNEIDGYSEFHRRTTMIAVATTSDNDILSRREKNRKPKNHVATPLRVSKNKRSRRKVLFAFLRGSCTESENDASERAVVISHPVPKKGMECVCVNQGCGLWAGSSAMCW